MLDETFTVKTDINNKNIIENILINAGKIKCRYQDFSKEKIPMLKKIHYSSIKQMIEKVENDNIMDCTSVLWNLILREYISDDDISILKEYKSEILESNNPKFHIYFPRIYNDNDVGALVYLEYTIYHHMMEKYFKTNLIAMSTNSMGWWCLCLGLTSDYYDKVKELWIGDITMNQKCYLTFWGVSDKASTVAVCNISTIEQRLICNAKKDLDNYLKDKPEYIKSSVNGIINITLEENNITMDTIKYNKLGTLFKAKSSAIAEMYTIAGNNYL